MNKNLLIFSILAVAFTANAVNKKISELPSTNSIGINDTLIVNANGVTKSIGASNLVASPPFILGISNQAQTVVQQPASYIVNGTISTNDHATLNAPPNTHISLLRTPFIGMNIWYSGYNANWTFTTVSNAVYNNANSSPYALNSLGWNYIELTDGWLNTNRTAGHITPNPVKFADLTALTNFVNFAHSKGIYVGAYVEPTAVSCGGQVGCDYAYIEQDVADILSWGIDVIRIDFCNGGEVGKGQNANLEQRLYVLHRFRAAMDIYAKPGQTAYIRSSGWNIASPGVSDGRWDANLVMSVVNILQVANDSTGSSLANRWTNFVSRLHTTASYNYASGPGHWLINDVSVFYDPDVEYQGQAQWGMNAIAGFCQDVPYWYTAADQPNKFATYTNLDVFEIQYDPLAFAGYPLVTNSGVELWVKKMNGGKFGIGLLNESTNDATSQSFTLNWTTLGLPTTNQYIFRNCFDHTDSGPYDTSFTATVTNRFAAVYIMKPYVPTGGGNATNAIANNNGAGTNATLYGTTTISGSLVTTNGSQGGSILSTNPVTTAYFRVDTNQNLTSSGTITASAYYGNGANLTNLPASGGGGTNAGIQTLTDSGGTVAISLAIPAGALWPINYRLTLTEDVAISNPTGTGAGIDGEQFVIEFLQDGAGNHVVTLGANFVATYEVPLTSQQPGINTAANKRTWIMFIYNNVSGKCYPTRLVREL